MNNPGKFNEKIDFMEFVKNENTFIWESKSTLWAKVEQLKGNNIFSQVGIGVKSIKFTIRKKSGLTLHNAFKWNKKHCFVTDIIDIDRMYYEVTAALIEPKICSVKRDGEQKLDELNRPVYVSSVIITFPGCLTEKYIGYNQEKPMAVTETKYVLVVPKAIELNPGETVTVADTQYEVTIPHILDEYKNEYEITVKEDV